MRMLINCLCVAPLFAFTLVNARDQWSLKTGDTSLTVLVNANQLTIASLSSAGGAPNWVKKPVLIPLPDHVFRGSSVHPLHWKFSGVAERRGMGETTLRFVSDEPKLELLSIWQTQNGPGPIEHHFDMVNQSGQVIDMPLQPSLTLT